MDFTVHLSVGNPVMAWVSIERLPENGIAIGSSHVLPACLGAHPILPGALKMRLKTDNRFTGSDEVQR